jgi:hypothetical protein
MKILCTIFATLAIFTSNFALGANQLPARAIYKSVLPEEPHPKLVDSVEIAVDVAAGQANLCWYQLTCTKVVGESFTIWFLADANPFTADTQKAVNFNRYILQEQGQSPIEYIEERSGKALLPLFDFVEELLPRAAADTDELLFEKGSFLGHPLVREQFLKPQPVTPPQNITKLVLNPNMLIGTGHSRRDDRSSKKRIFRGPKQMELPDYKYVPFVKEDYDEMIEAGINFFNVNAEQLKWVYRRAAFYRNLNAKAEDFPEELYRSNFRGVTLLVDEPAELLARHGKYPKNVSLSNIIEMLHQHIFSHYRNNAYRSRLVKAGIDLGLLKLTEPETPIWETIICTSYYQLETIPVLSAKGHPFSGIVHECRWKLRTNRLYWMSKMLEDLNAEFGTDIPLKAKNRLLWDYAQMRGAARTFNAKWGIALYGQAEDEMRIPGMKLAYDLGATTFGFWTGSWGHHILYEEQLVLARALTDYAKSNPRPPIEELMRLAKTAIVMPYGYTLPSCYELTMFGSPETPLERKNRLGITYKEVLTPAVKEIERCLKNNILYDVVVAGKDSDPTVYDEVIWIREDGTVRISQNRSPSPQRYRNSNAKLPKAGAR